MKGVRQSFTAGCRSGVLDELFLAVWLIDQVVSDAWFVNVLDENTLWDLGPG